MKKLFLLFAVVLLVAGGLSAFAQETTWINPFAQVTPGSMLAEVSSGLFYDELDILFLSPAELSNYKGTTIYTAYGNNEFNWATGLGIFPGAVTVPVNPFVTAAPTQPANLGVYQLGIAAPVFGVSAGLAAGFNTGLVDNMSIGGTSYNAWSETASGVVDANANNTTDYSYSNTQSYNDGTATTYVALASGVDLNFMGLSLAGLVNSSGRNVGGNYTYAYTQGTDAAFPLPADVATAKTVNYGTATGATVSFPTGRSQWYLMARGELPLALGGISMPLTATLMTGSAPAVVGAPALNPLESVSITTLNVGGTAAETSSLSYTRGWTTNTADPTTESGVIAGTTSLNQAALRAAVTAERTALAGGALALDAANYKNSNFHVGLAGNIDPVFKLSDRVRVKTRGQIGYSISFTDTATPGSGSISYSEGNTAATNSTYSYTRSSNGSPTTGTVNNISGELGGVLELNDSTGFLTVGAGLLYDPVFNLRSETWTGSTSTVTTSWTDTTNTDPQAAGLTNIGPGVAQGTRTDTNTTTYANGGKYTDNTIANTFYLPVSARLNLVKDKLSLIGGYTLQFAVVTESISTPVSAPSSTTSITNTSGTNVYTSAVTTTSSSTNDTTDQTLSSTVWNGIMNFMLRFTPVPSVTVDVLGATIMNALNQTIFGGGGFNPNTFISSLGLSVTFHVE